MKEIKVSIIIPVFNTEKYLRRCMDSVMNQTLTDIEIICVDDGSTDQSLQILNEYSQKDDRVIVVHKENEGPTAARKTGLDRAVGEYVGFVDSDDWIEADMYESLYQIAVTYDTDLVTCGYFLEGNYTSILKDTIQEGFYEGEKMTFLRENTIYNLEKKDVGIRASLCCKLFRNGKINEAESQIMDTVTMAEDRLWNVAFMLECESAYVCLEPYYHYVMHENSLVHKKNVSYLLCVNEVYKCFLELVKHPNFTTTMRLQAEIYITEMLLKGINTRLGFENRNMLWIDPYWLDRVPKHARIVLYGAGELGLMYKRHMNIRTDLQYVGCVDYSFERFADFKSANELGEIRNPAELVKWEYDYVIITIKNKDKSEEIKNKLSVYADKEKVLWFKQEEIYWKYIEAAGYLD